MEREWRGGEWGAWGGGEWGTATELVGECFSALAVAGLIGGPDEGVPGHTDTGTALGAGTCGDLELTVCGEGAGPVGTNSSAVNLAVLHGATHSLSFLNT